MQCTVLKATTTLFCSRCLASVDLIMMCARDVERCQIDDAEDAQIVSVMLDPPIPDGFDVCNTEIVPGVPNLAYNLQVKLLLPF